MDVLKLAPPFTYSYQCGSTLLTSYIPVYMYTVLIQIIVDILRVVSAFQIKFENFPKWMRSFLPKRHIKSSKIISSLINSLVLLLSFGLTSPVLCVCICVGVMTSVNCWLILIGKIVFDSLDKQQQEQENNNEGE